VARGPTSGANGELEIIPLNGIGSAINNYDQVVGDAQFPGLKYYGFLYEGGASINLNDVVVGVPGLDIVRAYDINDKGHITAGGLAKSWAGYALLLSPAVIGPLSSISPPLVKYFDPYLTGLHKWMPGLPWRGPAPGQPVDTPTQPTPPEPPGEMQR
jgi:hypothetical protein